MRSTLTTSSHGTGLNRGLKLANAYNFTGTNTSFPTGFHQRWTENYGYDPNFDYLTAANYGDSQPNASQAWTDDAAGNRSSDYTGSSWSFWNLKGC